MAYASVFKIVNLHAYNKQDIFTELQEENL